MSVDTETITAPGQVFPCPPSSVEADAVDH
jgi:hypothetical protein